MDKYAHPGNREFFTYLMNSWKSRGASPERIYVASPHPELVSLFDGLVDELTSIGDVDRCTMYGVRFAVTRDNLVFAWAHGVQAIFIKLQPEWHKEALADGGRLDATYPANWVEFLAYGTRLPAAKQERWRNAILQWMQIGYNEAAGLSTANLRTALHSDTSCNQKERQVAQEKRPRATRINLILSTNRRDMASLDPVCRKLLGERIFGMVEQHLRKSGNRPSAALSDKSDLSITFPDQNAGGRPPERAGGQYWGRVVLWITILSFAITARLFGPLVGSLVALGSIVVVMAALAGFAGFNSVMEVTVRGDLADVMSVSEMLKGWLSKNGRSLRLEVWDTEHLEATAQTGDQVEKMFQVALDYYQRKSGASAV